MTLRAWDATDVPNARNSTNDSIGRHCVFNGYDYVATVRNPDYKLLVSKRAVDTDGPWQTVVLSSIGFSAIGDLAVDDSHNQVALVVDSLGYIHIAGNSHDEAGEGLRYVRSTNPQDITSWVDQPDPPGWAAASPDGTTVASTYHFMDKYSDGEVVWAASMSEAYLNPSVGGRDIGLMSIRVGSSSPVPTRGVGNIEIMTADGGVANSDSIPDRSYLSALHVDQWDTLHLVGVWRIETSDGNTQSEAFYARSFDRGQTWVNVANQATDAPFLYRKTLDGAAGSAPCAVAIGGEAYGAIVAGNLVTDAAGNPYFTLRRPSGQGGTKHLVYWTGSAWAQYTFFTSAIYMQCDETPTVSRVGNDIYVWGIDIETSLGLGSNEGYWKGAKWSSSVAAWTINMGRMQRGTPEGVYQFENGATWSPTPYNMGGRDAIGNHVTKFLFPDGNEPMIRSLGFSPARFQP